MSDEAQRIIADRRALAKRIAFLKTAYAEAMLRAAKTSFEYKEMMRKRKQF